MSELTFAGAARKVLDTAEALHHVSPEALRVGADIYKAELTAVGGTMRNLGKSGARLTAGVALAAERATITPKPVGAWAIREFGARQHVITPRGGFAGGKSLGSRKRRALGHRLSHGSIGRGDSRAVLNIPGIGFRRYVEHAHASPRPRRDAAIGAATPRATAAMRRTFLDAALKAF